MKPARLLIEKLEELRRSHDIELSHEQVNKLVRMDELVIRWNRSMSLIGFASDEERIDRFFIEAVHASKWLPKHGVAIDIGSGGGSPVLPMAVCRPDLRWTLLEPNLRKKVFLDEISEELELERLDVVRQRSEVYTPKTPAGVVTTRGVSMSAEGIMRMSPWLEDHGQVMLLTGGDAKARIARDIVLPWQIASESVLSPRQESWLVVLQRG